MSADNLIDRVAREITASVATPDLARRVGDRIAETPQQPRAWSWKLVPVAGLATAAVILAVSVMRPATIDTRIPGIKDSGSPGFVESANPRVPKSEQPGVFESRNPRIPESRHSRFTASPVAAEWQARALPALPAVEPLAIDRIQPIPLSIPLLEIEPLVVPAIGNDR
jgi:hypothetical protein